jgi:hypothetical protein
LAHVLPSTSGGRRNLAALLTAGENLLIMDDQIIVSPWTLDERQEGLVCGGHFEQRDGRSFAHRQGAFAATTPIDIDLLHSQSVLLEQRFADLLKAADRVDFRHACAHVVAGALGFGDYVVRLVATGIAGESAMWCPQRCALFASGRLRAILAADETAFRTALDSREVHRIARSPLVTHNPAGIAHCVALSNRVLMPPFMPHDRNDEVLWAAIFGYMDPYALYGHVPYGVFRDSGQSPSGVDGETIPSATGSTLSDLFAWILERASRAGFSKSPLERCGRLATVLHELSELDTREFGGVVTEAIVEMRCRELGTLEDAIAKGAYPQYWLAAFEEYRRVFRVNAPRSEFCVPVEFRHRDSSHAGFDRSRRCIAEYAMLLKQWPALWNAAHETAPLWAAS